MIRKLMKIMSYCVKPKLYNNYLNNISKINFTIYKNVEIMYLILKNNVYTFFIF